MGIQSYCTISILNMVVAFFWTVAIVIVSYLAWELHARGFGEDVGAPYALPIIAAAIQLFSVIGFGGALTFLGFHTKLSQIEKLK